MQKILKLSAVAICVTGLVACGGGGSSSLSAPLPAASLSAAQGVYQGAITSFNGNTEDVIVLEDGTFWGAYGVPSGNGLAVQGILYGSSNANNGSFSASASDFLSINAPASAQLSGTYVTGASLVGNITEIGLTSTFNLSAPVQSTYNYNTAANIASIAGSWSGGLLNGETATINIQSNGTFSGTSSLGCVFFGTATPRPSGKNVFNVSLTFGASPCVAANQTVSGIGLTYPLANNTNQLIVGLVNPSQTLATAFFAQR